MTLWSNHEVTAVVRKGVQHDQGFLRNGEYQILLSRLGTDLPTEKAGSGLRRFDIFHAPAGPEQFTHDNLNGLLSGL
jgi:hypothetical protein